MKSVGCAEHNGNFELSLHSHAQRLCWFVNKGVQEQIAVLGWLTVFYVSL